MKKGIQVLLILPLLFTFIAVNAQSNQEDKNRIALTAWVPDQIEGMPASATNLLENKLSQVATKNGMSGDAMNSRFIISANVSVITKNIVPGPPTMVALGLDATLYIGDGYTGQAFESMNLSLKGVGNNETKAYLDGIKMIKPGNTEVQAFIERGKTKIINYYKANCDLILKQVQSLEAQNQFEEALFQLSGIPSACEECYTKALNAIGPVYQKMIDRDCKIKLQEAKSAWNSGQDRASADAAGQILSTIEPSSSCYGEVKTLTDDIAKRVLVVDGREWKFILRAQEQESERIQAARDVGVAFGNGQPDTVIYRSLW